MLKFERDNNYFHLNDFITRKKEKILKNINKLKC